jgi:hypothetical protein
MMAAFGCNFEGDVPIGKELQVITSGMAIAAAHDVRIETIGLAGAATVAACTTPRGHRIDNRHTTTLPRER